MNTKTIFGLLSILFVLAIPFNYIIYKISTSRESIFFYFFLFLIPLSIMSAISFFKFNLLNTNKSIPKIILSWIGINFGFGILYVINYMINISIIRTNYGWYSDMAGAEIFIIVPILFIFSIINIIGMISVRNKEYGEGENIKGWVYTILISGIITFIFMFGGKSMIF